MALINNKRIDNLEKMMHTLFYGVNSRSRKDLENKVERSVIDDAVNFGLIVLHEDHFYLTSKGKNFAK